MNWDRRPQPVGLPTGTSDGPSARRAGGVGRRIRRGDVGPHRERGCAARRPVASADQRAVRPYPDRLAHRASGSRPVRKTRTLTTSAARPLSAVMSWNVAVHRVALGVVQRQPGHPQRVGLGLRAARPCRDRPGRRGRGISGPAAGSASAGRSRGWRSGAPWTLCAPYPGLPAHRHAPQDAVIGRARCAPLRTPGHRPAEILIFDPRRGVSEVRATPLPS